MLPPLLCIHGAANAAWVWQFWRRHLGALGWQVHVIDLRGHGQSLPVDFSIVTMEDYAGDVDSVVAQMTAHYGVTPVLMGWSMGGLIAMMSAVRTPNIPALLLLEPSSPLEVAGRAEPEVIRSVPTAPIGPEYYGIYPDDFEKSRAVMPDLTEEEARLVLTNSAGAGESGFARRQRSRGISIPATMLPAPKLVIYGEAAVQTTPERTYKLAAYLTAQTLNAGAASHWGLVMSENTVQALAPRVDAWLRQILQL